jgi:uncharacterized protein
MPRQLPASLLEYFKSKGISVEACTTPHAAGSFNILNAEGRNVVAALLTLKPVNDNDF